MKRPILLLLLWSTLASTRGFAADAADPAVLLDAREEELLASLEPAAQAALLRGESQPLPSPADQGLLFHPLEPCRLAEGRELADPAAAASLALEGAGGCGVPQRRGRLLRFSTAASVLLRIELRDARGEGTLALWRGGGARPAGGLLAYQPGRDAIGTAIVPVCREMGLAPCAEGDLAVAADGAPVLLTVDLLGYFAPSLEPPATSPPAAVAAAAPAPRDLASPFWESGAGGALFYDDGPVGIGTNAPLAPLEVWGAAANYPGSKAARFVVRGESPTLRDQVTIASDNAAVSASGYGLAFAGLGHHRGGIYARDVGGSGNSKGELDLWARSGGNIVLSAGAVGVGVAEPAAKLHVGGELRLNLGEGLRFGQNADYWAPDSDARLIQILDGNGSQGNADGGLVFESQTPTDGQSRTILTLRHHSGYPKVGIGTAFPAGPLEIHTRLQTGSGTLSSAGTAVTGAGTSFLSKLVAGSEILADGQLRRVVAIASNTELTLNAAFATDLAGAGFSYQQPALLLSSEGKLGLGTGAQAPTERLEVVGNLKLSGNLLASGDLCIGACP